MKDVKKHLQKYGVLSLDFLDIQLNMQDCILNIQIEDEMANRSAEFSVIMTMVMYTTFFAKIRHKNKHMCLWKA